jgi:hypothetical protein
MFGMNLNLYCIGATVLGLMLGYAFAYSARQQQPNGNEVAALFGTVLGGTALSLLKQFDQCADALPLYVIGVAAGYLGYVFLLKQNWTLVQHLFNQHGLTHTPLLPSLAKDPCCTSPKNAATSGCCGCNNKNSTDSGSITK